MARFKAGDWVKVVDVENLNSNYPKIKVGDIYQISEVREDTFWHSYGLVGLEKTLTGGKANWVDSHFELLPAGTQLKLFE